MADQSPELLRETPTSVVTSADPRSQIGPGQVEQPFNDVSALLGKFGQDASDLAVPFAKQQATADLANQKVVRGSDGQPQVLNPASAMIFGQAGETYARAVQSGTSDQILATVRPDLADIHSQNPLDAGAVKKGNDAYLTKLAADTAGMGQAGAEVMRSARDIASQHQDMAITAGANNQVENTKKSILATLDDSKNALNALASTPGGPNKQEWEKALSNYDDAQSKLGTNQLFKMPADYLAIQRKQFMGELQGQQLVVSVDSTFDKKGKAEAQAELMKLYQNPDISHETANLLYRQGMSHLEFRTNDQIAAQQAARGEIQSLREAFAKNAISPNDPLVATTRANALKAGGPDLAAEVDGMVSGRQAYNAVKGLPLAQVPAALGVKGPQDAADAGGPGGRVGGTNSSTYLSALARGDVEGALRASEGLRTTPYWDVNHLRTGYGSDTVTLADGTIKTVDANTRITPDDANRDLARRTVEYATGARNAIGPTWDGMTKSAQSALTSMAYNYGHVPDDVVRAAKTGNPAAIAAAITAHANDNNGANFARRIAEANAVTGQTGGVGGPPTSINGNPFPPEMATNPWARSEYFRLLAGAKDERNKYFETSYQGSIESAKAGIVPPESAVTTLIQTANGDPEKEAKVTQVLGMVTALKASQGQGGGAPMTTQQIAQTSEDMRAAAAKAPDMVHQNLALTMSKQFDEIKKQAATNPLSWGADHFKLGAVPQIDPSQPPQQIAQALAQRGVMAERLGVLNAAPAPSLLDKGTGDVPALQGAMQGQNGAQLVGAISQSTRPQDLMRLSEEPAFRDSLTGMSRSGDPAKMNAAYSMMDKLQTQNPLQFDATFKDGLKDLRAWQSSLAFYPPDVAAKRLMAQYDPSQAAAIETARKTADEALKTVSPAQVVSKFNTGIPLTPVGTTAQAPASPMQGAAAQALKDDYAENYKDGFTATGDKAMADKFAMEKLALKYSVSGVNGNRVTAYAPEATYKNPDGSPLTINGSFDWMQDQLDHAIADHFGVKADAPGLAGFAAGPSDEAVLGQTPADRAYRAPRALVPDQTTQADITAHRPPSYQVIVQGPDGRFQAMTDPGGKASRFRFDPAPYQAQIRAAAEGQRGVDQSPANDMLMQQGLGNGM